MWARPFNRSTFTRPRDGLPGHVHRACADQLASVFTDIFNISLTESVIPTFQADHHSPCAQEWEGTFAYRPNRSTDNAISISLHTALSHLDKRNTYVRMLFIDYSSVFNTIVPTKLITKIRTLRLNTSLCNWILDFLEKVVLSSKALNPQLLQGRLRKLSGNWDM